MTLSLGTISLLASRNAKTQILPTTTKGEDAKLINKKQVSALQMPQYGISNTFIVKSAQMQSLPGTLRVRNVNNVKMRPSGGKI